MIQIIATRQCDFACRHCMLSCTRHGQHMDSRVLEATLPYMEEAGSVNVIGGEPTLHPDLAGMLRTLSQAARAMRIATNGSWVLQRDRKRAALDAFITAVTILGTTGLFVRISNDAYHRAFIDPKAMKKASDALTALGIANSCEDMDSAAIYPIGRAARGGVYREIGQRGLLHHPAECSGDYAWQDNLSIDANGDASPCSMHQKIVGNILTDSYAEITQGAGQFIRGMNRLNPTNNTCRNCRDIQNRSGEQWNN